ncbi:hypothetical protein DMN91_004850 [Ooceraea biroi]|uniref:Uncharacterized protein n=1 Tax=Ooceraea biroi TaxID=2015173 RepID=A0A026WAZ8_OOCBI|nr:uncharacterized protein LOC105281007 [Ooceraea biroi]EZA53235.1 hypothetical protein X777_06314 [Ooceraea biroi]RLU22572.1 hypothetical protein DMN91_004850 [Ooceraea biroi]
MRLPLLVLCVAVIYGTCRIYGEENVNSIESVTNDGYYKLDYSNVPVERALSRHKRNSILSSPITKMALKMLGIGDNSVIVKIINFFSFVNGVLTGTLKCPKVERLSINLIKTIVLHPIETLETIVCYFFNMIGSEGRAVVAKVLHIFWEFLRNILLPGLYRVSTMLLKIPVLPPSVRTVLTMFNLIYNVLKLLG